MKKLINALLFLTLATWSSGGVAKTPSELLGAVENIYAANFGAARSTISAYLAAHPDESYGYLLRGMTNEWDQLLNNKGSRLDANIMADYEKARQLAETKLDADPDNNDKKIDLANALIYVAKKQIDQGHKIQSGTALKKASSLMQDVIEKDPANAEAYFAIGLFNYFADNVPSGFKWLAAILGFRGDRNKGLSYIQKAATAPSLTQGDAKFMLVYIYSQKESNYAQALVYARELNARYPANIVFLFDHAEMLFRTKKITEARERFARFFESCSARQAQCPQKYEFLANYFVAWSYMDEKNHAMAKKFLESAIRLDTKKFKDRTADLKKWTQLAGLGGR